MDEQLAPVAERGLLLVSDEVWELAMRHAEVIARLAAMDAVGMAHALGMTAVGEGIETPTELDELAALQCNTRPGIPVRGSAPPRRRRQALERPRERAVLGRRIAPSVLRS